MVTAFWGFLMIFLVLLSFHEIWFYYCMTTSVLLFNKAFILFWFSTISLSLFHLSLLNTPLAILRNIDGKTGQKYFHQTNTWLRLGCKRDSSCSFCFWNPAASHILSGIYSHFEQKTHLNPFPTPQLIKLLYPFSVHLYCIFILSLPHSSNLFLLLRPTSSQVHCLLLIRSFCQCSIFMKEM